MLPRVLNAADASKQDASPEGHMAVTRPPHLLELGSTLAIVALLPPQGPGLGQLRRPSVSCLFCLSACIADSTGGSAPVPPLESASAEKRDAGVYVTLSISLRLQGSLLSCHTRFLPRQPQ